MRPLLLFALLALFAASPGLLRAAEDDDAARCRRAKAALALAAVRTPEAAPAPREKLVSAPALPNLSAGSTAPAAPSCACGSLCCCKAGECPSKCPTVNAPAPTKVRYEYRCVNGRCYLVEIRE